ncbi:MAG: hypothetical protein EB084_16395 [Proteobacteria bacterium]|nr:hypothetical protein [Pseudomonadota bacterium]
MFTRDGHAWKSKAFHVSACSEGGQRASSGMKSSSDRGTATVPSSLASAGRLSLNVVYEPPQGGKYQPG